MPNEWVELKTQTISLDGPPRVDRQEVEDARRARIASDWLTARGVGALAPITIALLEDRRGLFFRLTDDVNQDYDFPVTDLPSPIRSWAAANLYRLCQRDTDFELRRDADKRVCEAFGLNLEMFRASILQNRRVG